MGFDFLGLTSGCRLKNFRGQPGLGGLAVWSFKDAEVRCLTIRWASDHKYLSGKGKPFFAKRRTKSLSAFSSGSVR
jgi:hypothetical protein